MKETEMRSDFCALVREQAERASIRCAGIGSLYETAFFSREEKSRTPFSVNTTAWD